MILLFPDDNCTMLEKHRYSLIKFAFSRTSWAFAFQSFSRFHMIKSASWCRKRTLLHTSKHLQIQNCIFHTASTNYCSKGSGDFQNQDGDDSKSCDSGISNDIKESEGDSELGQKIQNEQSNQHLSDSVYSNNRTVDDKSVPIILNKSNQSKDILLTNEIIPDHSFFSNGDHVEKFLCEKEMNFKTGYTCHFTVCPKLGKLAMNKLKPNDRIYINSLSGKHDIFL